ncbi:outer membrane efflux protein [Allomuricauda ruestringensis DSM 13258]|uniref:Outer membrane efflux protein n=1 Tax=Allomuricauda ruestringensis (strain DSM 13258 / CIP 107369 / LMG 19739 / B1) TaxID=886377 RepID=G2PKA8_ALLRU|nr:TolC family protein [Allomuricauda ruestringensis]AEM69882.1 outer membrane efflux protein [Allomuricauda ruestringensis DSM 13258]
MKSIFYTVSLILLFFGPMVNAQDQILTKQEAIDLILENNLDIKVARNTKLIDDNNADILNSGYLPSVTGNASGSIDKQNSEGVLGNGDTRTAEGAETRRYSAAVNVNYTLFDGLGRYYNYKSFQERSEQSELEVRQTIENTILQLFTVYYEAARLTENTATLEQALEISKDRLKRAQYQFEYGQNTGLDVLNAEVDINTDSINLLNSKQQLRNTMRDLNLILNRNLSAQFSADTTVTFVPGLQMENMYNEAQMNNVRLQIVEKDINMGLNDIRVAKSGYLPTIGLTGTYGWNESNNNSPLAFVLQNTSTGVTGTINLTWNLFDGGTTITGIKNAKIAYKNQEIAKKQIRLEVERDIRNAWDSYTNALYVLEVQEKNLQTNQNNFKRTDERYKLGQITSIEFRQAQLNLLNAELAKSQAKYNAKLAELQMLQVSGQLLNVDF